VHDIRKLVVRDFQTLGEFMNQFLQGAKRTQPAAIHAAPPQQQCQRHESPQDKYQRIDQKGLPGKLVSNGVDNGQHVNDRKLG